MMKKYGELNLRKIREDCGLAFAHFTYLKYMCSCCYGPKDFPKRYWHNGVISEDDDYEYILFKNADNGSGIVTKNNFIDRTVYVEWNLSAEKLISVCKALQEQLGEEYVVVIPHSASLCITILPVDRLKECARRAKKPSDMFDCFETVNGEVVRSAKKGVI